jgi:hypothetical protein
MSHRMECIERVCGHLDRDDPEGAKAIWETEYPHKPIKPTKRKCTATQATAVFIRDGFIDRYTGARLMFPGALRLFHLLHPIQVPFHPHGKMTDTHPVFAKFLPTIDDKVPVTRNGPSTFDNWVGTSSLTNSQKSNHLLEELGWEVVPPGDLAQWDGKLQWFLDYIKKHPEHLSDDYTRRWHRAALNQHRPGRAA